MTESSTILEINDLVISAGSRRIVDKVSFSILPGEIKALVGESGSGKTMTALAIMGLLPVSVRMETGDVLFMGEKMPSPGSEAMRRLRGNDIAMVFQEPFTALNPVMRVGDQVGEAILAHQACSKREAYDRILDLFRSVRLPEDAISHYPHELSGGMCQRVMLAMGLSCDPSVMVMDEPTTALDVSVQKHILELIRHIQSERNMAVLFITHDFSIVNMIADRICVMRKGSIVEEGAKEDVLKTPRDEYTRGLIACIPRLGDDRRRLPVIAENDQELI